MLPDKQSYFDGDPGNKCGLLLRMIAFDIGQSAGALERQWAQWRLRSWRRAL